MDLRHDYAAQRAGANDQRDIARDRADITADRQDVWRDRQDIRSDRQDIRKDRTDLRADLRGGQRPEGEHSSATRSATLTASNRSVAAGQAQPANGAQHSHPMSTATHPQALTPTVMANNAAAEDKKPPATKPVHQAWWHWVW
ncbi:MAG: hypothetical protein ACTHL7_08465 [Steroidobacteraceae bacterium]